MAAYYLYYKAFHVIGFVSWFAGLFYVVRLFIYHVEAHDRPEPERGILSAQFAVMERRLWFAIAVPAMIITLLFGGMMVGVYVRPLGGLGEAPWLVAKLALVLGLVGYHHVCGRIRKQLAAGRCRWTSARLRLWNEVATLFLVAIVLLAVLKGTFSALWGTLGLVAFGILLGGAVNLVRRRARARAAAPAAGR